MTVTCSPANPSPGDRVTISHFVDPGGGEVAVLAPSVTVVSVPPGSTVPVGQLEGVEFVADVTGQYSLLVTATRESVVPPVFPGDSPSPKLELLASEAFTVYVTDVMVLPIEAVGSSVKLRIVVANSTVVSASVTDGSSELATASGSDSTVLAKLSAMAGASVSSLGVSLKTAVSELRAKYVAHLVQAGVHPSNDTTNTYPYSSPESVEDAVQQMGVLRTYLERHLMNGTQHSPAWHTADDTKNVFVTGYPVSLADAIVSYADARRVYEAHRIQTASPASHSVADSTNTLSAVDKLSDAIIAVINYLRSTSPSTPSGSEAGSYLLTAMYGFSPEN